MIASSPSREPSAHPDELCAPPIERQQQPLAQRRDGPEPHRPPREGRLRRRRARPVALRGGAVRDQRGAVAVAK